MSSVNLGPTLTLPFSLGEVVSFFQNETYGVPCDTQQINVCLSWLKEWKTCNSEKIEHLKSGCFANSSRDEPYRENKGVPRGQPDKSNSVKWSLCIDNLKQTSVLSRALYLCCFSINLGIWMSLGVHFSEVLGTYTKIFCLSLFSFNSLLEFANLNLAKPVWGGLLLYSAKHTNVRAKKKKALKRSQWMRQ